MSIYFNNLLLIVNEYASELESALILVDSLKASMKRARFHQHQVNKEESGGPFEGNKAASGNLEIKLKELKDERAELYRQQGIQATHLLSLNDQLRSKDTIINTLNSEMCALKTVQEQRDEEVRKLKEKIREGEEGARIIGDELVALQLELLRLDRWQPGPEERKEPEISPPGGSMIIVDNSMKITKEKEIIAPHQYPISSFASKPSTRQLLTGSEDQKIILYDLTRISTKLVLKWAQMNGPIVSLAIDEEAGRLVASCSAYDKEVTIWNLISGKIQSTLQFTDESNDGKTNDIKLIISLHSLLYCPITHYTHYTHYTLHSSYFTVRSPVQTLDGSGTECTTLGCSAGFTPAILEP